MRQSSDESTEAHEGAIELSESDRHRLLASERRRVLLDVLVNRTSPVDLGDLAAAVVARESDGDRFGSDAREVAITLHHQHLPMLTDAGVVEYQPSAKHVEAVHATGDLL